MLTSQQIKIMASCGKKTPEYVIKNAKIVNVFTEEIIEGDIAIENGTIIGIGNYKGHKEFNAKGRYVCPGLIDSHVHIESTMVTPRGFAKTVIPFGTTSIIADPHEIANVCGLNGIEYMIKAAEDLPLNIYYMLPSCVPAVAFENNGGILTAKDLQKYINHPLVLGLGEVMDYPSVIKADNRMLDKINLASHKIIDGHSPHLQGKDLMAYRLAGIDTDHECSTAEEAIERLQLGMTVQIREGSAARNLEDILSGLIEKETPLNNCVFCTDDRHLDHIMSEGHIDQMVNKAISLGLSPIKAIALASIQPAKVYNLKYKGAIAPGYDADLLVLDDLRNFKVNDVMLSGKWVSRDKKLIDNNFRQESNYNMIVDDTINMSKVTIDDLQINLKSNSINVIKIIPGQIETKLVTRKRENINKLCKIAVIERHKNTGNIGLGYVEGLNLKNAAIAQSIAHDSHNIVVLGDNDMDMTIAANRISEIKGGIVLVSKERVIEELSLPIGGLMSPRDPIIIRKTVNKLNTAVRKMGVSDSIDPFITLSFISLPVIPNIRMTDQGLFNSKDFKFIDLERI